MTEVTTNGQQNNEHSYLTPEFLHSICDSLKKEIEGIPDHETLLDLEEYNRWLSDEWTFSRYVKRKRGDVQATLYFLIEVLKWRRRIGISQLSEKSFPKEFFDFGGIHVYGKDREGDSICHVRLRLFYRQPEILELLKKFVVWQMFRADEEGAKRGRESGQDIGWILLFDCTGAGVANSDMDMTNFLNSTLKNYFPYGQKYVLTHNLPWLLNAIKNVVFTWLPSNVKRRIKFSNDKSIGEFIDVEHLPPYMGGKNQNPYPTIPNGVLTTSQMVKEGILPLTDEEEARVQKYYERVYADVKKSNKGVLGEEVKDGNVS